MMTIDEAMDGAQLLRDLIQGEAEFWTVVIGSRQLAVHGGKMMTVTAWDGNFGPCNYVVKRGSERFLVEIFNDAQEVDYVSFVKKIHDELVYPPEDEMYEATEGEKEPTSFMTDEEIAALRRMLFALDGQEAPNYD